MPSPRHFHPALFAFLRELKLNNRREWFAANKERYEDEVKIPAQRFIADLAPGLARMSPHFLADPRPVGGSLFRIYRDTRFGRDKTPFKTHLGIQFRHRAHNDVHAPGFYLHLEPRGCFAAVGCWQPDAGTLERIRSAIQSDPRKWKRARDDRRFSAVYTLSGASLKRPPRGYDPEHPFIEDLKRTDLVAVADLNERIVTSAGFIDRYSDLCRAAAPFVRFLCKSIGVPY